MLAMRPPRKGSMRRSGRELADNITSQVQNKKLFIAQHGENRSSHEKVSEAVKKQVCCVRL